MPMVDYARVIGRAAFVRNKAGLFGKPPPYSMTHIMETCYPKIHVTGDELPRGVIEVTERNRSGATIFYARKASHPVQRVGIAHGLHHLLSDLRRGVGLAQCNVTARQFEANGLAVRDPVEAACDLFAGELLVPLDVLDEYAPKVIYPDDADGKRLVADKIDQLASLFNVPAGFIRYRLYDLNHFRRTNFAIR